MPELGPEEMRALQNDAVVEIFNIAVGQAADTMSQMVHDEILLSVPAVSFVTRGEAVERLGAEPLRRVCSVMQHFSGGINTDAILMFPEEKSLELVRLVIGEEMSLAEMTDLEQEAMSEIGNIVLNACMSGIADLFRVEFVSSLPRFRVGSVAEILGLESGGGAGDPVMLLFIDFRLQRHEIQGYVAFVLDIPAYDGFNEQVARFVAGVADGR
jgi:chemotaxis protein CheC